MPIATTCQPNCVPFFYGLRAFIVSCAVTGWLSLAAAAGPSSAGDAGTSYLPDQREAEAARFRRTLLSGPVKEQSEFGRAWFPETLRAPEMDLEYSEMRLDWFHAEKPGNSRTPRSIQDEVKAEFERAFGSLTLEVELPYQGDQQTALDAATGRVSRSRDEGFSRIELGVRYPLFQYVSADGGIDYTCVGAFELALPTGTRFSKDTEISPRLYQLLRVGDHLSVQASAAWAAVAGPDQGGSNALEYGASFAYVLQRPDLRLPGVVMVAPMFELVGDYAINGEDARTNGLFGVAGIRVNTESLGWFQPRVGLGYQFPIDRGARQEQHWGLLMSFVFEL
jgi:hypothetical protein